MRKARNDRVQDTLLKGVHALTFFLNLGGRKRTGFAKTHYPGDIQSSGT